MTFDEFCKMPKGIALEEYERLLREKKTIEKQITAASNKLQEEEDSLEILVDEIGSERYNRHLKNKLHLRTRIIKLQARLTSIESKLK